MRTSLSIASVALLAFACAGSQPGTRTASGIPTAQPTDNATGIRTVTAPVVAVGPDSIQFGPSVGNVTLKVDASTAIVRGGLPVSEGLSAIREGQQVRASFDATRNHATRIELVGSDMIQGVKGTAPHAQPPAAPTDATTAPQPTPGK